MKFSAFVLCAVTVLGLSASSHAADKEEGKGGHEGASVAVADLPKPVLDAVATAQPGGKIVKADKETRNGVDIYEVDVTNNGKKVEVKVDASGKLLGKDEGEEKESKAGGREKK